MSWARDIAAETYLLLNSLCNELVFRRQCDQGDLYVLRSTFQEHSPISVFSGLRRDASDGTSGIASQMQQRLYQS